MSVLWNFADATEMTCFGTSAAYVNACMKAGIQPCEAQRLDEMRSISSTGSPLSEDGFRWIYGHVKKDVWLSSVSGGTDLCTPIVGGCPILPVNVGEIQCRYLGAKVLAFDETGTSVTNEVGELVVKEPMPSMPLYFWNDPDNQKYRQSYFAMFPGFWRHGDWIKIDEHGHCVIYGRSDSTIKRHGIRIGTSELYTVIEALPEVSDSLVVDLEGLGGKPYMAIFLVLKAGSTLDQSLKSTIMGKIRSDLSPRYVPDDIFAVDEIPKTLNGKKLEVPVKRVLLGYPLQEAVNLESMANPSSIQFFVQLAKQISAQ
jgi:acetoacetyl-CoA synthetase